VTTAEALGWGFDEPSATISGGGSASGGAEPFANANYRRRLTKIVTKQRSGGSGSDEYYSRSSYRPAPTITGGSHRWVFERPATTVVGQFRPDIIAAPGFRKDVSRQNAAGSVRVTVQDVATLQGFRPDYPWQGPRTKQHEQVGNAVPPPLAAHVLAAAIGMTVPKERTT
jgi:DNA (cytosine-5)-methyltransferase 1